MLTPDAPRVLVVEDDEIQVRLVTHHLTAAGFDVRHVGEAIDALGAAVSWLPDAMVSDVLMPSLDGFELCRALRRHPALGTLPIILYSSVGSTAEAAAVARRAGATGFVPRTADFGPLIDLLRRTLEDGATRHAGAPAAIDAERSRLFAAELRRHVHGAEALSRITRELTLSLDVATVVTRIVESATTLFEGASSVVWDLAPDGSLHPLSAHGVEGGPDARPCGQATAALAIQRGRAVWIDDGEAMLAAPLRVQGRIIGAIGIAVPRARGFAPADTTLAERFADQAALALANARLFEDSERRRREAESLAEMNRALSEQLDPDRVAGRAIALVSDLLRARSAAIYRLNDDGDLALTVSTDAGQGFYWAPVLVRGTGAAGRAVAENRTVISADVLADDALEYSPAARAGIAGRENRAILAVPLRSGPRAWGALAVGDRTGRIYDDEGMRLAQAFADQAAIALENARLHGAEVLRSAERAALLRTSRTVMAGLDLDVTLERIVEEAAGIARTPYVKIFLLDAARGVLRVAAERSAQVPVGFELPVEGSYSGRAVRTRKPVFVGDTQADPANPMLDRDRAEGVVTYLGLPIRVATEVLGVLVFNTTVPHQYSADEIEYLSAFADQAAIAIRNAALFRREHDARADAERSRESLRLSEARHRAIVDHSSQGMLIHRDDRILFVNRAGARLVGYESPDELIGASVLGLVAPEDRERLAEYARAHASGQPLASQYELRAMRRDGEPVWLECLVSDIHWDGEPAVLATLVDIGERKRSEEALRQTEEQVRQLQKMEAIGRLAGGVAHDFNNLLTVIMGRAEILGLSAPAGSAMARGVDSIRSTARRASNLTRQLLAFSRKQVLDPRVVDLGDVVAGLKPMLRGLIGEDIEITTSAAGDVGRVLVDPAQAEQVVMNLAVNARDAMPRGGRLMLDLSSVDLDEATARLHVDAKPGRYVLLQVSDTGGGMDAATRARIFEPFFTTKEAGKGTGLGLSTVFGVVKQSGGHIEVHSEPGRGSTFKIYFPLVDARPEALVAESGTPALAGGSETVLVVEDDQSIRDLIVELLESAGYGVLAAGSGPDALALAQSHDGPIDLLLTDVIMPRLSGRDVAERFTGLRPAARVLYVSGYTDDMISHHGLLDGDAPLLTKPFTVRALLDRVRESIDAS